MDPGEAVVLFGVVIVSLLFIAGLMVTTPIIRAQKLLTNSVQIGTAWFFGARFDKIWSETSVYLPTSAKPSITGHDEL